MKKSKIIVPALGIMCLSTAAAVTGTVAWFTAARVKSFNMSGITAVNPESGLTLSLTNVNNTVVTGEDPNLNVKHAALRDGSVDVANGVVYGSVLADDGTLSAFKDVTNVAKTNPAANNKYYAGNVKVAGVATDIFYATEFTADFGLSRDGGYVYNLFFDAANSSVSTPTEASGKKSVLRGLRIDMKAGSEWFVWAPLTNDTAVKYVSGLATTNVTTLTADNLIKGAGTALPSDEIVADATAQARVEYLGKPTEATPLTVTIYTWFEGTDSAVVNEAVELETAFSASLSFKMIRNA
jgi:hypothetical protein